MAAGNQHDHSPPRDAPPSWLWWGGIVSLTLLISGALYLYGVRGAAIVVEMAAAAWAYCF